MNSNQSEHLNIKHEGFTLWITLNRPQASNAYSEEMINSLVKELYKADQNQSVRSIVITGAGKHFCAGGDVKSMKNKDGMFAGEANELRERYKFGIQQIPRCLNSLSKPVIAMINGAAIGAGLDLACMCDIRVASESAKFGETFAKLALVPGDGGTFFLQRIVGLAKAMELSLTGRIFDAKEANDIGLVNYVVKQDELMNKTNQILTMINQNSPIAIQMLKRALIHGSRNDLDSNLEMLSAFQGISQRTSDHFEALNSIENKCQADFKHS